MADIRRWEYRTFSLRFRQMADVFGELDGMDELNQLGTEGWEVVSVLTHHMGFTSDIASTGYGVPASSTGIGETAAHMLLLKRPVT
jgi:hypothetical protein